MHRASAIGLEIGIVLSVLLMAGQVKSFGAVDIDGELRQWHRVTLTFDGPASDEDATPNPFRDYRLTVTFRKGERWFVVPGYFAADGQAAETAATRGNKWRAHFAPPTSGTWTYSVSFRGGRDIAVRQDPHAGTPLAPDGATGKFEVGPTDKSGRDHRGKGLLQYVGEHYLRFAGSREWFLKGGADSPENFLAYADFDGTRSIANPNDKRAGEAGRTRLHRYTSHIRDWQQGDPTWRDGKGKGIIGALSYLSSKGMNSAYFLTMNVAGDGKDVWPWTDAGERYRFDCSKLDQWEIVFTHMDRMGVLLHVITQEQENDQLLDGGELGVQRRLYYRELIARCGHHLALVWNLGEENTNTHKQREQFCHYVRNLDPYDHPIVAHTFPGKYEQVYAPLIGLVHFEGPSLQTNDTHTQTIRWIDRSAAGGRKWVVCLDEIGPAHTGVKPDRDDPAHDEVRKRHLWGNLMAGGAGCEWYFGYRYEHNDLNCEDWRSRDRLWDQTRHALEFFQRHLPFDQMRHADGLTKATDDYCFALPGKIYAIYLPHGASTELFLPEAAYRVSWFNPRQGGPLQEGAVNRIRGPGWKNIGDAPADRGTDWVAVVQLDGPPPSEIHQAPKTDAAAHPASEDKGVGVQGFALVDAETDRVVSGYGNMQGEVRLDLAKLPSRKLNLVANVAGDRVTAVRFDLDGRKGYRTERTRPFALAGDTNGDFNAWTPSVGVHTVTATPLVVRGDAIRSGRPVTLRIHVTDSR